MKRLVHGATDAAASLRRIGGFPFMVRTGLLLVGLAAGMLVTAGAGDVSLVLGVMVGLGLAAGAVLPGPAARVAAVLVLALWLATRTVEWPVLAALMVLVWLAHRLGCWAELGPVHGEVTDAAWGRLLGDAAVEALWVAAVCALLLGGGALAARLPAGGGWAWLLLGLAAAAALAWLALPRRRG